MLVREEGSPMAGKTVLSRCQSERGGKRFRDAEQFDRHQTRSCMHVASEALLPVETIMRPLRAGQGRRPKRWRWWVDHIQREERMRPDAWESARSEAGWQEQTR